MEVLQTLPMDADETVVLHLQLVHLWVLWCVFGKFGWTF